MAELDEAELVKNKIQACVVGIVTQNQGEEGATLGGVVTDAAGNRVEKFRPGMLAYGPTGADIKFNNPQGNSTFSDFWTKQLQSIAVGMNVMYEHLSGDLGNVNYSSFRGGLQIYRPFIESLRWNILVPLYCKPTWERVMQVAWGLGRIPKPKVRVDWTPPKFMSVDPKKDADSDQMELRDGTLTWPEAVARKGYDPEQQFQTLVKWKNRFAEAGLILDCDPSVTDASGKQKVAQNEEKTTATAAA
jgi:lambda family phage portal protein